MLLRVEPVQFRAASRVVGETVADRALTAAWQLVDDLAGVAGMAGSDPAGQNWGAGYDRAARAAVTAVADVARACFRVAALLQQSGLNYGRAEASSAGATWVEDGNDYVDRQVYCPQPESAVGDPGGPEPLGWSLVQHLVGYVWPNGHQDRLHAAATAWRSFAATLVWAADDLAPAVAAIADQQVPEIDRALAACDTLRTSLHDVAGTGRALADACEQYAGQLDDAHSQIEHELVELLAWTAAIEAAGAVGAVFTFGASEAVAQAAETSRIAATAARIAEIIQKLIALARGATEYVANLGYDIAEATRTLNPLLTSRIVTAVAEARVGTFAGRLVVGGNETATALATAGDGWTVVGREALSPPQLSNLDRFARKLPSNAEAPALTRFVDGSVQFAARVPGRVPGSYATYTKVVGDDGITLRYFKTTVAPDGTIVHVKVKYP